jgi:hypothetical protein
LRNRYQEGSMSAPGPGCRHREVVCPDGPKPSRGPQWARRLGRSGERTASGACGDRIGSLRRRRPRLRPAAANPAAQQRPGVRAAGGELRPALVPGLLLMLRQEVGRAARAPHWRPTRAPGPWSHPAGRRWLCGAPTPPAGGSMRSQKRSISVPWRRLPALATNAAEKTVAGMDYPAGGEGMTRPVRSLTLAARRGAPPRRIWRAASASGSASGEWRLQSRR